VVSGHIEPVNALVFGIALNVAAFVMLSVWVNPLSALLTLSATLFYVFVYTMALKRTTPHNIVIGGAAGAIPPMVGWAAVTGSVDLPAVYLFALVFFWTPPHFWALSLLIKDDYERAKVPMLPVVAGVQETKRQVFLYTILVFALSLMLVATGAMGVVYLASALVLGAIWVYYSYRLLRSHEIEGAKAAYLYSLLYLALLFVAIMADSVVKI
jgi:protoheme IX farnesyltransferase